MELNNYKFINYKKYQNFAADLADNKISNDSIVFIQDKLRIWARGKEYVCNGPKGAELTQGMLSFTNSTDDVIFQIGMRGNQLVIVDDSNNEYTYETVSPSDLTEFKTVVNQTLDKNKITVDTSLSESSTNAVENRAITLGLKGKVSSSDLNTALLGKQNKLTAGDGIRIDENGYIEVTVDTDIYVIVDELPTENIISNKIYLVEEENENHETSLYGYKYVDGEWVSLGEKGPSIDLSEYQKKGDYALRKDVADLYNYIDTHNHEFEEDYASVDYVTRKLEWLQGVIAQLYVPKIDVYTPNEDYAWDDPEIVPDNPQPTPEPGSGGSNSRLVTLTTSAYQLLVDTGNVKENVYYFTYEPTGNESWHFGDNFPIILTGQWTFGEAFPITLS